MRPSYRLDPMDAKSLLNPQVVAALVAFLGGVLAVTAPRILDFFSRRIRRLNAIELAKKRVEFWDQFLKVELETLMQLGGDEERMIKDDARAGIARARNEANVELRRLQWIDEEERVVGRLTFGRRTRWFILSAFSLVFRFAAGFTLLLLVFVLVRMKPLGPLAPDTELTVSVLAGLVAFIALMFSVWWAERGKAKV